MYPLSEEDFQTVAAVSLRKIFINENPFDTSFAPNVQKRVILFPYDYVMEQSLLESITRTALSYNDIGFYTSILGHAQAKNHAQPYHWHIPFTDVASYRALIGPVENVVYSPNGLWGIICSHESHGLLGGTTDFIDAICREIPSIEQQVWAFVEQWKNYQTDYGTDISWLPRLLIHTYGAEKAHQILSNP